jgi:hypothetical protein
LKSFRDVFFQKDNLRETVSIDGNEYMKVHIAGNGYCDYNALSYACFGEQRNVASIIVDAHLGLLNNVHIVKRNLECALLHIFESYFILAQLTENR